MTETQDPSITAPSDASEPPTEPAPATVNAAPPRKASKVRLFLIIGALAAFLAFVLYETRNNQSADDLTVGTCFDVPSSSSDISTVTRHECTESHDAEVFAVAEFTSATSYPISLTIQSFVNDTCVPVFQSYVGESYDSNEDLTISYFYPNSDGWDSGDRTVTCYVTREDEAKLTKSVKGSAGS